VGRQPDGGWGVGAIGDVVVAGDLPEKAVEMFQFLGNAFRGANSKLFPQPAAVSDN